MVGGGPAGAALALALALADLGPVPLVIDPRDADIASAQSRPLALSHASRLILDRLGVWTDLDSATPIARIHVSQQGGFGRVALTAAEAGLPALGYVVDYGQLYAALAQALAGRLPQALDVARVNAVRPGRDAARVELVLGGAEHAIAAKLVVVADGGALRDLGRVRKTDYRQEAVVGTVTSELPHGNVAYERFTANGPLALLPFGDRSALVWSCSPERARELSDLPDGGFLAQLHRCFGDRLGAFTSVGARSVHPLALKFVEDVAPPRTVLIGNAAQTLHPVAGQGFNLGLRDAWELAGEIARTSPEDPGSATMLSNYRARRRLDRLGGIGVTDLLVRLFSNDIAALRAARGAGLALLGCVAPARDFVVRRMIFGARG